MRVEQFLEESARRYGEKVALISAGARLSYAELDERADRLAATLVAGDVARGDRVLLFMENGWEAVVGIFAVLKAGAVLCPINSSAKAARLRQIAANCRPTALITQAALLPNAEPAVDEARSIKLTIVAGEDVTSPKRVPARERRRDRGIDIDLAMLLYTSGSTGSPKGVMITHQNIVAAATSVTSYLENTADDVILSALPLSFDYGLYQVLMAAKMGATLVLEKSFAYPQLILDKLIAERVTGFPIVPTMASILLQGNHVGNREFPQLRYLTSTAAPLPPAHIPRLRQLFPGARLYSMYGLVECKRCTWLPPAQLDHRPDSVGIAIPNTETYVVDENGEPAPPGVVGELVVRGAHVMQGYWEDPVATARVLRPGRYPWERVLYTGDLFRSDAAGYLYFVARKDDMLKSRGQKVSPKEIENVLYAHPAIREAAVVGVPDPILGTAVKVVIALAPGERLTEHEVIRHCRAHLEDFMVPKFVEFRSSLPKTDSGKITRRAIRDAVVEAAE